MKSYLDAISRSKSDYSIKQPACLACGSKDLEFSHTVTNTFGDFHYIHCKNCNLFIIDNPPTETELSQLYQKGYFSGEHTAFGVGYGDFFSEFQEKLRLAGEAQIVGVINKLTTRKENYLDIGAAAGYSMENARRTGWQHVYGIERSPEAATEAKKKFGLDITVGKAEEIDLPVKFDAVLLLDTIEHFADPLKMIKKIYDDLLTSGGILMVRTPNAGALDSIEVGEKWSEWKPEHLTIFSEPALRMSLEKVGFKIEKMFTESQLADESGIPMPQEIVDMFKEYKKSRGNEKRLDTTIIAVARKV